MLGYADSNTVREAERSLEESPRVIGPLSGFSIVAGSMVGVGIFLSPSIVASHISSAPLFFAMWALGGLISLAGAVACAELGAMMPKAGGDYVFQHEAFGPSTAFASGSVLFAAIFCGSIATLAVGLCSYQIPTLLGLDFSVRAIPLPLGGGLSAAELAAMLVVLLLTTLNARGAEMSARTQSMLTLLPIILFSVFAIALMLRGHATESGASGATLETIPLTAHGVAVSYMAVYFAYSGWINIIYVAGEVDEPGRNIPRSLLLGTLSITLLYLLLCGGFYAALGMTGMRGAGEAGSATAALLGGDAGSYVMTMLIACALTACTNGAVLGGARVAFAMARQGALVSALGTLQGEHQVPRRALWLQAVMSCVLIASGTFEQLLMMVSCAMVITGTLTVSSVFVLRHTQPDRIRPYRATAYPVLPGFYVVASFVAIAIMVSRAVAGEKDGLLPIFGLAVLVGAYLLHRYWLGRP
jgi:APA family basic amino acid/polyamine antiporter